MMMKLPNTTIASCRSVEDVGSELEAQLRELTFTCVVILQSQSVSGTKLYHQYCSSILRAGKRIVGAIDIPSEPQKDFLLQVVRDIRELGIADTNFGLLAIGGGSVIDGAKVIAFNFQSGRNQLGGEHSTESLPTIIAIPTTAGTGSEVTRFAVFCEGKLRKVLIDKRCIPKLAILDGRFQNSAPCSIRTFTAFDALTHAVESLGSPSASSVSKALSREAIRIITRDVALHCAGYEEIVAQNMVEAAMMAGLANEMAGCGAVHAMAYALTEQLDFPHGFANALCLPLVVRAIRKTRQDSYPGLQNCLENNDWNGMDPGTVLHHTIRKNVLGNTDASFFLSRLSRLDVVRAAARSASVDRLLRNTPIVFQQEALQDLFRQLLVLWQE